MSYKLVWLLAVTYFPFFNQNQFDERVWIKSTEAKRYRIYPIRRQQTQIWFLIHLSHIDLWNWQSSALIAVLLYSHLGTHNDSHFKCFIEMSSSYLMIIITSNCIFCKQFQNFNIFSTWHGYVNLLTVKNIYFLSILSIQNCLLVLPSYLAKSSELHKSTKKTQIPIIFGHFSLILKNNAIFKSLAYYFYLQNKHSLK